MVFCDHCNLCYHQKCHVGLSRLPDKKDEWFCHRCTESLKAGIWLWSEHQAQGALRDLPAWETMATHIPDRVKELYSIVRRHTGGVGGNADGGAIYGEMTMGSFQRLSDFLVEYCEFGPESCFLDVGAGLGKPCLHAALSPGVKLSYGIELVPLRWQLSLHNLVNVMREAPVFNSQGKPSVFFQCGNVDDAASLDPFTHVFMYDIGFSPYTLGRLASVFNNSTTPRYLVSFQKPKDTIHAYGFMVRAIGTCVTSMSGSNERHTAYIYRACREEIQRLSVRALDRLCDSAAKDLEAFHKQRRAGTLPIRSAASVMAAVIPTPIVPETSAEAKLALAKGGKIRPLKTGSSSDEDDNDDEEEDTSSSESEGEGEGEDEDVSRPRKRRRVENGSRSGRIRGKASARTKQTARPGGSNGMAPGKANGTLLPANLAHRSSPSPGPGPGPSPRPSPTPSPLSRDGMRTRRRGRSTHDAAPVTPKSPAEFSSSTNGSGGSSQKIVTSSPTQLAGKAIRAALARVDMLASLADLPLLSLTGKTLTLASPPPVAPPMRPNAPSSSPPTAGSASSPAAATLAELPVVLVPRRKRFYQLNGFPGKISPMFASGIRVLQDATLPELLTWLESKSR